MPDRESIRQYLRQITDDAQRFAEVFDERAGGQAELPPITTGVMRNENDVVTAETPTPQARSGDWPDHDVRRTEAYANRNTTRRQENTIRTISEALGHELSVQRRMRGL